MKKIIIILSAIGLIAGIGGIIYLKTLPEAESVIVKNEDKIDANQEEIKTETGITIADIASIQSNLSLIHANSELFFTVDGMSGTKGRFDSLHVNYIPSENIENAKFEVIIEANSIYTASKLRDEHLLEADFFHTEKFPKIKFESNKIILTDTSYLAQGTLDFLGSKKDLNVPIKYKGKGMNNGQEFHVFEGNFSFNRIDYGMEPNSMVGDNVDINFYLEMQP